MVLEIWCVVLHFDWEVSEIVWHEKILCVSSWKKLTTLFKSTPRCSLMRLILILKHILYLQFLVCHFTFCPDEWNTVTNIGLFVQPSSDSANHMSLRRDSLLLWPMALLFLRFRLVTSALSRAAHRGLSKGQVFSQECLLIAGAPPSISGQYPRLSGARLISSHLTAGRQVPTDSSQTSRKSAAIDTKHIRLRQSSQFISKSLVKGEIFWIQGVPHPSAHIQTRFSSHRNGNYCSVCIWHLSRNDLFFMLIAASIPQIPAEDQSSAGWCHLSGCFDQERSGFDFPAETLTTKSCSGLPDALNNKSSS